MRMTFEDLGIANKLVLHQDGLETVNYIDALVDKAVSDISNNISRTISIEPNQPCELLLLDMRMPMLNGLQVLMKVKEKFKEANLLLSKLMNQKSTNSKDEGTDSGPPQEILVRPLIAYLSQLDQYKITQRYCEEYDMPEVFLSKPLPVAELEALMKIIKII